jgi:hypothetical protein
LSAAAFCTIFPISVDPVKATFIKEHITIHKKSF